MDILPTRDQTPQPSRPRASVAGSALVGPRPSGAGASGSSGLTGKDIFYILRKRMWLIIITSSIVFGLVAVGTVLWYLYAPFYKASAVLTIDPSSGPDISLVSGMPRSDIMDRLMQNHAQMIKSDTVLTRAVGTTRIQNTLWFQKHRTKAVEKLSEEISVRPIRGTSHIEVSMSGMGSDSRSKTDLAEIVNAIAGEYVAFDRENASQSRLEEIQRWNAELADLQTKRTRALASATAARRDAPDLQKRRGVVDVELQLLTTQLMELESLRSQARAALQATMDQDANNTLPLSPDVMSIVDSDPTLKGLQNAEAQLLIEQDNVQRKYGPQHRMSQNYASRVEGLRREISEREKLLTQRAIRLVKSSRQSAVESYEAQLLELRGKINEVSARARDLQASLDNVDRLVAEADGYTRAIEVLDRRIVDLRFLEKSEREIRLAAMAIPPREISQPKFKIMLPMGLFLGLGFGLGLALLLELTDTSVKGPSDITRRMEIPILGMVPYSEDLEEEIDEFRLAFASHPESLVSEAFRQIRTGLLFSGPADKRRVLLVTSPLPEDGRTTVALNLAAAIAQGGRNVLVIDANFRQPAIRALYPKCPECGLSSALVGQGNWKDMVYEAQPNLHLLAAGPLPPNPAELLGSDQMRRLLDEMRDQYDQIIIDGTPCLVVTDSVVLGTIVDGVILTVRAGVNSFGVVQRTREMMAHLGGHIIGVVLNGVRATAGGYLRKNYETYYEYHQERLGLPESEKAPFVEPTEVRS